MCSKISFAVALLHLLSTAATDLAPPMRLMFWLISDFAISSTTSSTSARSEGETFPSVAIR